MCTCIVAMHSIWYSHWKYKSPIDFVIIWWLAPICSVTKYAYFRFTDLFMFEFFWSDVKLCVTIISQELLSTVNSCLFLFCFVVWSLSSHSRIFHSYEDATSRWRAANKIISEYTLLNPKATAIPVHWGATAKHWGATEKHWDCHWGYLGATTSTEVASEGTEALLRSTEGYFSICFYQLKKQETC